MSFFHALLADSEATIEFDILAPLVNRQAI